MFESGIQANHCFGRGLKQRLRFGIIYLFYIFPQMLNQLLKSFTNIAVCALASVDAIVFIKIFRLRPRQKA